MELINLVKCINAVRDSVQVLAVARAIISAIPFAKIRSKFDCMKGIVFWDCNKISNMLLTFFLSLRDLYYLNAA